MLLEPVNAAVSDTSSVPGDLLDDLDAPMRKHLTQLVTFLVLCIEVDASNISHSVPLDGGRLIEDLWSAAIDMERLVLIDSLEYIVPLGSCDKRCLPHFIRALHFVRLLSIMINLLDNFAPFRSTMGKKLPSEVLLAILNLLVIFLLLFLNICLRKPEGLSVRFCPHILHTVAGTHVHIIAWRIPVSRYFWFLDSAEISSLLLAVYSVQ